MERTEWFDDDLYRPLIQKGIDTAESFFQTIKKLYEVDLLVTSKATRALETAKIFKKLFDAQLLESDALTPGCSFEDFEKLYNSLEKKDRETIAFFGHEPDFSEIISRIISNDAVAIKLKKPSVAEVILYDKNLLRGELKTLLSPAVAKKLTKN